jgi:hypothetical protein
MAVDVTTEIFTARPHGQVAAYAGDPSNAPRWYADIASPRWRTTGLCSGRGERVLPGAAVGM